VTEQRFNSDHKAALDAFLLGVPGVTPGQMMGHPGYFIAGKMFALLVEDGFAMKLPDEPKKILLAQDNTALFAPGGTPMRNWVQVRLEDSAVFAGYGDYLRQAIEFVLEQAAK
jgi:hypothetical protein